MAQKPQFKSGLYEQIRANVWRSRALLALLIAVLGAITYLRVHTSLSIVEGMLWLILSAALIVYFYRYTDGLILSLAGAIPASGDRYRHYLNCVEAVPIAAGIPAPKPYIIDDPSPASFAVGRDPEHSSVCVTTGLIALLNRSELEAVVGHEIAHIAAYDTKLQTLTTAIVWAVLTLSMSRPAKVAVEMTGNMLYRWTFVVLFGLYSLGLYLAVGLDDAWVGILGALAVLLVLWLIATGPSTIGDYLQSSISRQRDFLADANAALFTRHPQALLEALTKLSKNRGQLRRSHAVLMHLLIHNPSPQHDGMRGRLLATHPPIEERIRRLEEMAAPRGPAADQR